MTGTAIEQNSRTKRMPVAWIFGILFLLSTPPVLSQTASLPPYGERLSEGTDFVRQIDHVQNDPATLNQERLEDLREFERLTTLSKQIKPYCRSHLAEAFPLPEIPVVVKLPPGLTPLWLEAMAQPEAELQLKGMEAISQAIGLDGADFRSAVALLMQRLDSTETDRSVRLAAARCLIEMKLLEAAPLLRQQAATGLDFAQLIEPALAHWNDAAIRDTWLSRLENGKTSPGWLLLAIRGAARTQLQAAAPSLRTRVHDVRTPPHLRLEAARALGQLADNSVIADARQLVTVGGSQRISVERLMAAHLLVRQSGAEGISLLQRLALDPEPTVSTTAFRRLLMIDPQLTRTALDRAVESPDPQLRETAVEALYRLRSPADISRLGLFLGDSNSLVRSAAQHWLIQADAIPELSGSARDAAMEALRSTAPHRIARAAIVIGQIEHRPAAGRLVELLEHKAWEVSIAAAWGLRRLAVPETAEPIFRHLKAQVENSQIEIPIASKADLSWTWDMYEAHKHLIETLGILRYKPADSLLRQFVPVPLGMPLNHPFIWIHCTRRVELRGRAIWALGQIHAGSAPSDLVELLKSRLEDEEEQLFVSAMAALALGGMNGSGTDALLRNYYRPEIRYTELFPRPSLLAQACRVALQSMTGESPPPLEIEPFAIQKTGWFLEPLESSGIN